MGEMEDLFAKTNLIVACVATVVLGTATIGLLVYIMVGL